MAFNSERLRLEIVKSGLSQRQIAELAGCSHVNISLLCNGKSQTSKHLPAIARVLGVSLEDLDSNYAESPKPQYQMCHTMSAALEIRDKVNDVIVMLAQDQDILEAIKLCAEIMQDLEAEYL